MNEISLKLKRLFKKKGNKKTLVSNVPLILESNEVVLINEKNAINLFALKKRREERRHFIACFEEGLLFPLYDNEQNPYQIAAISEGETSIYIINMNLLAKELLADDELQENFSMWLSFWIYKILEGFYTSFVEEVQISIFPGQILQVEERKILHFKKSAHTSKAFDICWVEVLEGKVFWMGNQNLLFTPSKELLPITSQGWLVSAAPSKLRSIDSSSLVKQGLWMEAIHAVCKLFFTQLSDHLKEMEQKQQAILENRAKEEKTNLSIAFNRIRALFAPIPIAALKKSSDPLQQALQAIGAYMKINFVFPKEALELIDEEKKLQLICDASRIRNRKVKLGGNWWKKDHGPLLSFEQTTNKPIALLNLSPLRYDKVDTYHTERVTKNIAQDIAPTAYMFYIPFDASIKSGKDIIRHYLKNHHTQFFSLFLFSIIGSLIAFFPAIATKLLFNYAIPESNPSLILYLTLGLLFSAIGFSFFYFLRNFSFLRIEGIATHLLQCAIWDRILKLPTHFFRKYTIGNLLWRIMSIDEIRTLVSGNTANVILTGLFSILFLIIMYIYSPLLTSVALGVAILSAIITGICCYHKVSALRKSFEMQGKIRGALLQIISGVGKLRVSGAENSAFSYWAGYYTKSKSLQMKAQNIQNIASSFSAFLPIVSTWCIYGILVHWIGIREISLPDFLAFNMAYGSFILALFPLNTMLIELIDLLPLWERTNIILEEPLEEQKEKMDPGKLSGAISIDEVVFGYDLNMAPIVDNVSIKINPGEFVAIVGPSGSGKSTLVRLLLGFEKLQSGAIYFDGKDLTSLDPQAVRRQMGVVFQREGIMAGSIYDNLVCGGFYTIEQIETALKLSEFEVDVNSFPMGLHTIIPMNGETMSGGQKQRLLLARALLANPSILIFDEATSALDNQAQARVSANIANLSVTRIVVAQRLSTIKNANKIYVMEKGEIIQAGNFDELALAPGLFAQMLSRQKL